MTNTVLIAVLAVYMTESRCGKDVRDGDGGRAVGPFQTWEIMVREVNRVAHTNYTYADRRDFTKSQAMCRSYLEWQYRRGVTDEVALACRWRNPLGDAPVKHRKKIRAAVKAAKEKLKL